MIPERRLTYAERMVRHRRFYIPASICLFLVYPGSVAAFLPSPSIELSMAQRVEVLLFYIPMVVSYSLLLIWAIPREVKIFLGVLGILLSGLLITLLLRTNPFTINFHLAVMRMECLVQVLPGLALFIVLSFLDSKKRDRSVLAGLLLLIIPLSVYSAANKEAVKFFDRLRLNDIIERVASREGVNPFMSEQCNLIADVPMKHQCLSAIAPEFNASLECDLADENCILLQADHARRTYSTHPPPTNK